jgi:hypothetical protein
MDPVQLITKYNYLPADKNFLLKEYKYHGSDDSIMSALLQPFWNWCSLQLPPTLAPNMVTTVGFVGVILSFFIMLVFTPNMKGEDMPQFMYIVMAVLFFFYQTMGKYRATTLTSCRCYRWKART